MPILAHLAHGVLGRLGLQLTCGDDVRHQRDVHAERIFRAGFELELTNGFQKRQRLDVADGAAHFDNCHVRAVRRFTDARLDFVGDVRNHLHGRAQVFAAALFGDDRLVDAAGRHVGLAG